MNKFFKCINEEFTKDVILDLKNDSGEIIGRAMLRDYLDGEIFLTDFEIFPIFRSSGNAQLQLKKLIDEYGVNSLTVAVDNRIAKHIYDKLGFKVIGNYYFDDNAGEDVYYMKLNP